MVLRDATRQVDGLWDASVTDGMADEAVALWPGARMAVSRGFTARPNADGTTGLGGPTQHYWINGGPRLQALYESPMLQALAEGPA